MLMLSITFFSIVLFFFKRRINHILFDFINANLLINKHWSNFAISYILLDDGLAHLINILGNFNDFILQVSIGFENLGFICIM